MAVHALSAPLGGLQNDRRTLWRSWTGAVFLGETLGFLVPAAAGAVTYALETPAPAQMLVIVCAGAIEGVVLGFSQTLVLRRHVPGFDGVGWIRNTGIAALFAWTVGMTPSALGDAMTEYWYVTVPAAAVLGPALLLSIGFTQYLVLRRYASRAPWWIPANAASWLLGITWVFVAMAFVSEGDPGWSIAAAGIAGGLLMALTVAAATGAAIVWVLPREQ